jgi:hypothetical protein
VGLAGPLVDRTRGQASSLNTSIDPNSNCSGTWFRARFRFVPGGQSIAKKSGDCAGHEEEHGASEEEAVGDPLVVEQAGCLGIQRAEETFYAAG